MPDKPLQQIRSTHPYGFRSGRWGNLISETTHGNGRRCYVVRFADGISDFWPIDDQQAGYEFRPADPRRVS